LDRPLPYPPPPLPLPGAESRLTAHRVLLALTEAINAMVTR